MMRVVVFGQPYWAKRLAEALNVHGGGSVDGRAVSLSNLRAQDLGVVRNADVLIRVGFRPGAATWRGASFDTLWSGVRALNGRARVFHYWIGTDVCRALRDFKAKKGLRRLERSKRDRHLAGAPWLSEELRLIGVEATTVYFPGSWASPSRTELPDRFSVLTYIPDFRCEFYGGPLVYQCAAALPMIQFDVIGGNGAWVKNELPNLTFWGWQSDVSQFYSNCTVVMRLVEHDALGGTVVEGLAAGRHVIYSYPFAHTEHVSFGDLEGALDVLKRLFALHLRDSLYTNEVGRSHVIAKLNPRSLTQQLVAALGYFDELK